MKLIDRVKQVGKKHRISFSIIIQNLEKAKDEAKKMGKGYDEDYIFEIWKTLLNIKEERIQVKKFKRYKSVFDEMTTSGGLVRGVSVLPSDEPIRPTPVNASQFVKDYQKGNPIVSPHEKIPHGQRWTNYTPPNRPEPKDTEYWQDKAEKFWDKINKKSTPKEVDKGEKVVDQGEKLTTTQK